MEKKDNFSGFFWGIVVGLIGAFLFPSFQEKLRELGKDLVKETLEFTENEDKPH